jgi:hypothetical protein
MAQMEDTAPTTTNIIESFNSIVAKTASMEGWSADMVDPLPPGICTLLHIQQDQIQLHQNGQQKILYFQPKWLHHLIEYAHFRK